MSTPGFAPQRHAWADLLPEPPLPGWSGAPVIHPLRTPSRGHPRLDAWLVQASRRGDVGECHALIAAGASPNVRVAAPDGDTTALIEAVRHAQHDTLHHLLVLGADPELGDRIGRKPLHVAAMLGDPIASRILLDRRACPNARCGLASAPLHLLCDRVGWARYPEDYADTALLLLQRGANPNARDLYAHTPLHRLIIHSPVRGASLIARILLEHGANPAAVNRQGFDVRALLGRMLRTSAPGRRPHLEAIAIVLDGFARDTVAQH